jgi:hypothetical protein
MVRKKREKSLQQEEKIGQNLYELNVFFFMKLYLNIILIHHKRKLELDLEKNFLKKI